MRREAADDDSREVSQLRSGIGEEIAGDGVTLVGGVENEGEKAREIGRWRRVRLLHEFVDGVELPGAGEQGGEPGFQALSARAENGGDGTGADPVAGALVGDGKAPAAGTRGVTGSVAAVDDGSGAGDRDHARTRAESGFEGDYVVADDFDSGRSCFGS